MPRLVALAALLATAAPAAAQTPPATVSRTPEAARLHALFAASDEAMLRRHPLEAIGRGDLRWADRIGDPFTDAETEADRAAAEANLAALRRIDRATLNRPDRIAYDTFASRTERQLRGLAPAIVAIDRVLPLNHFSGMTVWYPEFASGEGQAPFKTLADYDNNLKRNALYAAALDRVIARFREGMAAGITQPRLVVTNLIEQLDELAAGPVADSPFYGPVEAFPATIRPADRARLTAAYATQVREVLQPAHRRLRDFLRETYLPAARTSVGLGALPNGDAYYRDALEQVTSLTTPPEELHALGLAELARDRAALDAIRQKVGFAGDLPAFYDYLRTDQRFQPADAAAMRASYDAIATRVDARVREQFSLLPRTRLELKPTPALREKGAAPGSYARGTPDGSRPGVFQYNTWNLPARSTWLAEDLYLHEAVPGHHFQISLAQENAALPAFLRFDGDTAFVEGWGLYAEGLGPSLGMMTDPYADAGRLIGDAIRAVRVVADTGIHAKGWTQSQAIDFMVANAPVPRATATAEVERYIAMPAQAVAYKVGQLTILRLREKARATLGARFDPRAFHAAVLDTGALPLAVLDAKIDAWIGSGGR